ncbi:hypothetical protein H7F33_08135 [Pedobacter sp. PAMC26386]|nr:hypothetical protein H7F33_08135 [Pedobacter sp. PAMC26386]
MKRSVLTLCMLMGMIFFAKAQKAPPTASEMATKSIEAMDKKLKLNSTQKNIIYNYTFDLCKEQVALSKKQQTGLYNEEDISKFYRKQNETTKNIRNVLKGEQQTQYDQYVEEMLRGGDKKKKKGKHEQEEVVTGIDGLKLPASNP